MSTIYLTHQWLSLWIELLHFLPQKVWLTGCRRWFICMPGALWSSKSLPLQVTTTPKLANYAKNGIYPNPLPGCQWNELKQASSCYFFFCWDLAVLMPGLTSPHAKQVHPNIIPNILGLVERKTNKPEPFFPIAKWIRGCSQIFLLCWHSAVKVGLTLQDYWIQTMILRYLNIVYLP